MRKARLVIVALLVVSASAMGSSSAQTLTFTLFERYLDSLREQWAIPGLSVAIVQRGAVVWERGLGRQDVEARVAATPATPYFIGGLSQIFGATLLLQKCVDENTLELTDRVVRWVPAYDGPGTTVGQLLSYWSPAGGFAYAPARFADLTAVVVECADAPYRHVLAEEIFDRLGMTDTVPGQVLDGIANPGQFVFTPAALAQYADVLSRTAIPYRSDRGRLFRTVLPLTEASAADGVVTTVRDLARFDLALRDGLLLEPDTLRQAWTQARAGGGSAPLPTGLGWFVQNYNNEPLIWQFDFTKDTSSSIVLKLPNRDITFILLANSDGLSAPFALSSGDATLSPFARLFLRFFVP